MEIEQLADEWRQRCLAYDKTVSTARLPSQRELTLMGLHAKSVADEIAARERLDVRELYRAINAR